MINSNPPANEDSTDPSVARAERRLRLLGELADIGMELARALKPGDAPTNGRDPTEAFAPLSRAIRLTLALEAKTDRELRALKILVAHSLARTPTWTAEKQYARKWKLQVLVGEAIDAEAETDEAARDLKEALEERLDQDEAYRDFVDRPLRETVERLCKDLSLTPDWSRWEGDDWTGPPTRPRFSVFNTPSRKPLLDDDGEPVRPLANGHDLE